MSLTTADRSELNSIHIDADHLDLIDWAQFKPSKRIDSFHYGCYSFHTQ